MCDGGQNNNKQVGLKPNATWQEVAEAGGAEDFRGNLSWKEGDCAGPGLAGRRPGLPGPRWLSGGTDGMVRKGWQQDQSQVRENGREAGKEEG